MDGGGEPQEGGRTIRSETIRGGSEGEGKKEMNFLTSERGGKIPRGGRGKCPF